MAVDTDALILPVLVAARDSLRTTWALTASPPARIELRWGNSYTPMIGGPETAPQDEACPGIAWVRWVSAGDASTNFPASGGLDRPVGVAMWNVGLEIGVARCARQWGTGAGGLGVPTEAQWNALTTECLADAAVVRQAIRCAFQPPTYRISWGAQTPSPIEGNQTGSTIQVSIALPANRLCLEGCP